MDVILLWCQTVASTVARRITRSERGASLVEYGLLVVAILVAAAAAYRSLGPKVSNIGGG